MWDRVRVGRAAIALLLFVFVTRCGGGIRQDELECQQAAAYLAECCPGFDPKTLVCAYLDGVCGTNYPELDVGTSECIVGSSCESLVATGTCAGASGLADAGPFPGEAGEGAVVIAEGGSVPDAGVTRWAEGGCL